MVNAIIIGTIGLDDIQTPFGKVKGVLGGSATYASLAAALFTKPGVVAVVGTGLVLLLLVDLALSWLVSIRISHIRFRIPTPQHTLSHRRLPEGLSIFLLHVVVW